MINSSKKSNFIVKFIVLPCHGSLVLNQLVDIVDLLQYGGECADSHIIFAFLSIHEFQVQVRREVKGLALQLIEFVSETWLQELGVD